MNQVSQRCTPLYRRLEFCNLVIRGLLPEVLIAEPCVNFTRCREGFSAGEGSEVEQTARELAVLSRVLWCEFTWLICLVALGVIFRVVLLWFFLDSRAAGRGRECWEVGEAWIFASRASFGEGAGRFCQCLLGAVLTRPAILHRWTLRGGKRLFRGEGFGSQDPTVRSQTVGHRQVKPIPPFAKTAKSGAPAKSETQLRSGIARGSPVSCDAEDARKKGGPPAACSCLSGLESLYPSALLAQARRRISAQPIRREKFPDYWIDLNPCVDSALAIVQCLSKILNRIVVI
jgi:hypothetical protein